MKAPLSTFFRALLLLTCSLAMPWSSTFAQTPVAQAPSTELHRIVLEIATDNQEQWNALLNNVENARQALGEASTQVEIVVHGKALGLVTKDTPVKDRVEKIAAKGVVFAACENTMRKKSVSSADLLPVITTTDSGVAEVIRKQEQGWSYLKSGG